MYKQYPAWILRAFTSLIFIYAGFNHLLYPEKIFKRISTSVMYSYISNEGLFLFSIYATGVVMVVAGLLLTAGVQQRKTALALLIVLIPITLSVQLDNLDDLGPFFKNVAISGSLIFLINFKSNENKTFPHSTTGTIH
jgi:putative oxidoreductase